MPGYLLVQSAQVKCVHGGTAQPTSPLPRVKVQGMAVVAAAAPYSVAGCTNQLPTAPSPTPFPCVTGMFTPPTATQRVKVMGQAVLLENSQATCTPTGTPLQIAPTQQRVKAQ
ncbi:hypothetical protein [Hyalangium gracile]|uniref:hypothetical protein n=1 Tax=Hyalangium gracile TaxID=394092 RepID=UPI001CCE1496|nr:hypothetical protein [Hyalangium gracile]